VGNNAVEHAVLAAKALSPAQEFSAVLGTVSLSEGAAVSASLKDDPEFVHARDVLTTMGPVERQVPQMKTLLPSTIEVQVATRTLPLPSNDTFSARMGGLLQSSTLHVARGRSSEVGMMYSWTATTSYCRVWAMSVHP
jgi:hypothetical protein